MSNFLGFLKNGHKPDGHDLGYRVRTIEHLRIFTEHQRSVESYVKAIKSLELAISNLENLDDKVVDSPELTAKKRLLRAHRQWVAAWRKRWKELFQEGGRSDGKKKAIKELDKELKRFMDLLHNIQHDGILDSLLQTPKFTHPYEAALVTALSAGEILLQRNLIIRAIEEFVVQVEEAITDIAASIREDIARYFAKKEEKKKLEAESHKPLKQREDYAYKHVHEADIHAPHKDHYWEEKTKEKSWFIERTRGK